ncbi:MAG: amino acid adenylation domain-containing protein [Clostridia bacterium]|nr:amino acid adenylation domain-containing protein [Clostridia bacterium]
MQTNLIEYLEKSAKEFSNKDAFVDEKNKYTYRDIQCISKKIANRINESLNSKNNAIAVFIDRNALCLCGFFGSLYSGNYYVPIDNKMPESRMKKVLSNVDSKVVLFLNKDLALINSLKEEFNFDAINLDDISNEYFSNTNKDYELINQKEVIDVDPAYVIFTSGSTGDPKGIVISHKSVIDFIEWMTETFEFTDKDIMVNQAPFYFDLSVKDIYTTIKNGATCYIAPRKVLMFPSLLVDYTNEVNATSLIWATSCFNLVSNSKVFEKKTLKTVNKVILGGEVLYGKHLNNWKKYNPDIKYVNLYGPTEVTVDCTYYIIDKEYNDDESVPIGKACHNKEVYLLDDNLNEVSNGEVGQICVRGTGLAKGYINDVEKTKSSFVQFPKSSYPDIIYKTGDLGYYNEDGLIVFASRKDDQIKHMGYRIELGEIEKAINSLGVINNAICLYDSIKEKIVCIYSGDDDQSKVIEELQKLIPKYMLPNMFVKKEDMPLNANGKIDRVKLKEEYFEKQC